MKGVNMADNWTAQVLFRLEGVLISLFESDLVPLPGCVLRLQFSPKFNEKTIIV